jgi:hypothetical protein
MAWEWLRRLWEYKGPLPRGLDSMGVDPPKPTGTAPDAAPADYDG